MALNKLSQVFNYNNETKKTQENKSETTPTNVEPIEEKKYKTKRVRSKEIEKIKEKYGNNIIVEDAKKRKKTKPNVFKKGWIKCKQSCVNCYHYCSVCFISNNDDHEDDEGFSLKTSLVKGAVSSIL